MRREILAAAFGTQRDATLRAFRAAAGSPTVAITNRAARAVVVDRLLVTGRLATTVRSAPDRAAFEASLAEAADAWRDRPFEEVVQALGRWGERAARVARHLPAPLAGLPVTGWFGRQPLSLLFVRRVLEEWVCLTDVADDPPAPPPEVGHCLSLGVLATLPAVALPRIDERNGVVRLVVDVVGGERLAIPGRRLRRKAASPVSRLTWSFDFSRKHFGPRVVQTPEAVVRTTADTLALLAEARIDWRATGAVALEGDERLAAALLDVIPPAGRRAGATTCGDPGRRPVSLDARP